MKVVIFDYEEKMSREKPCSKTDVLAEFSVDIPERKEIVRQCKLKRSKRGYWVSVPSYKIQEFGKDKWIPFSDLYSDVMQDFQKSVIEALKPFVMKDGS